MKICLLIFLAYILLLEVLNKLKILQIISS